MTLSVVVREPETGRLAVAVCTAVPGVGMVVPFARGGIGAVATQAFANPYLGPLILQGLTRGQDPETAVLEALDRDPDANQGERQVHVIDAQGRTFGYTGENCEPWTGHRAVEGASFAGNLLVSEATIDAMIETHANPAPGTTLAQQMASILRAGVEAGGDQRGHASAALLIAGNGFPILRLHVESSDDPIGDLERYVGQTSDIQNYLVDYVEEKLVVPLG